MAGAREKDFVVNITKLTKAVNQKGFGLIMLYDTEHDSKYSLYQDISAVGEAFPISSKVYKIASRIFGQKPKVQQIAIIGNTNLEEKDGTKGVYTLTITKKFEQDDILNLNGKEYKCVSSEPSKDKNEFTGDDIQKQITSLKTLIQKYENSFDITTTTSTIVFTQKIAGQGAIPTLNIKGTAIANIQNTVKEKLLTGMIAYLNQIRDKYTDPFFLVCTDNSDDTIKRLSNWIDTQEMMYFVTSQNLSAPKLVRSENTVIMYHDDINSYVAEGLASYLATAKVGGVTAKFKEVKGVQEAKITTSQLSELHKANGFTYIEKMGLLQTTEGKTTSGEYIDVVMGAYWIQFKMEEGLAYLAANSEKIGFDNKGISQMVAVCNNVLKRAAFEQDIILTDKDDNAKYEVSFVPREQTDPNDVANRNYTGIKWTAKLAGAIHKAVVSGILEY